MPLLHSFILPWCKTNQKIKTANFLAAVVAVLLHNFNGPSSQESVFKTWAGMKFCFRRSADSLNPPINSRSFKNQSKYFQPYINYMVLSFIENGTLNPSCDLFFPAPPRLFSTRRGPELRSISVLMRRALYHHALVSSWPTACFSPERKDLLITGRFFRKSPF